MTEKPSKAVDLADSAARAAWLAGLYDHVTDLAAAAFDATAPPAERDLGRREARRIIQESEKAISAAFAAVGYRPLTAAKPRRRSKARGAP